MRPERLTEGDRLQVRLKVTNSGKRAGQEIVQLYLRDESSSLVRPDKELKGFAKVALAPGETKTVEFTLTGRDFACYDGSGGAWVAETGWFEILAGSSSADIRLRARVYLESSQAIKRRFQRLIPFKYFLADERVKKTFQAELGELPMVALLLSGDLDQTLQKMLGNMPIIKLLDFTGGEITVEMLDRLLDRINRQD